MGPLAPYSEIKVRLNSEVHSRNTRYAYINFICPNFTRKTEGGRTFSVATTQPWNELPVNLKKKASVRAFKNNYVNFPPAKQRSIYHF